MNRLAVSISILAVMAVGCAASVYATNKVCADMTHAIELTEKAYTNGDKDTCIRHAKQLDDIWDSVLYYSILVNDYGHVLEITASIAEVVSFAQEQDDELYTSCDRAQALIESYREMQIPTLWKIL